MEKATELIVEKMAQTFEADGLPRTAGRLLGYLLMSRGERSLDELAEALQVSKASISTNARMLERQGTLQRVTHPGDRRDYYTIADDLPARVHYRALNRIRQSRDVLEVALLTPSAEDPVIRERLESYAAFLGDLMDMFATVEARWRDQSSNEDPTRWLAEARG